MESAFTGVVLFTGPSREVEGDFGVILFCSMFLRHEETISSPSKLPNASTFWKGGGRLLGGVMERVGGCVGSCSTPRKEGKDPHEL